MIQLTERLWLHADRLNWIIGERVERHDKTKGDYISIDNPSYYATLAAALNKAIEIDLRMTLDDVETLKEVVTRGKELNEKFASIYTTESLWKPLNSSQSKW